MTKARKKLKNFTISKIKHLDKLFLIIYIFVLIISFFKVYDNVFDEKINMAGDNAAYYILGNAIASGEGYTDIQNKEKLSHNHFPVGYPIIIATVSKFFSNDIIFLKKVNGFFLLLSIGLLFLIVYDLTNNYHLPFITSLFTLLNFHLLSYSTTIMSEIPFLFFSSLSIWLLMKTDFTLDLKKNWLFFLLLISISFTYHIRTTGLALFGSIALFLFWKKNWKYLYSLVIGFIILALPWYLRNKSLGDNSYIKQLFLINPYRPELGQMELLNWFERFWTNLERYITREIPSGIFNFIEVTDYKTPITTTEWVIGIATIILIFFGLIKLKRFFSIIFFYIIASFAILLLWPDVWFGIRFLLPLIPLLSFLIIYSIYIFLNWVGQKVFKIKNKSIVQITMVVISLLIIKSYSNKSIEKLELRASSIYINGYQNYFELAKWIKENAPDSSVTCCRKERIFYMYSNKYVTGYKRTIDKEEQIRFLQSKGTDYVVLEKLGYSSTGRYLVPAIIRYPEKFKIIKHLKDPDSHLMKFLPELGYWGEWKNDKKNGKGTYVWENKQKFVGEWKDDMKNGKGILYFPNGEQIEGVWTNNILNGEVIIRSKSGRVIQKRIYENNNKFIIINEDN